MEIELNSQLENGNDNDVLDLGDSFLCKFGRFKEFLTQAILGNRFLFSQKINESLNNKGIQIKYCDSDNRSLFHSATWTEDVKCKILKINSKGWQDARFRIKISLEFEIDEPEIEEIKEPESPLDDLRRMINEATS